MDSPRSTQARRYALAVLAVAVAALLYWRLGDATLPQAVWLSLFVVVSLLLTALVALVRRRQQAPSSPRPAEVSEAPITSRDVSEGRASEEAPPQTASPLRAVFESSLDPIAVADDEGRIQEANPAACSLVGLPCVEVVGLGLWEFSASRAQFDAAWAGFLAQGAGRGEWHLRLPDGSARQVEFSATARFQPGRHLVMLRDVTDRHRSDRTLQFLARASRLLSSSLDERETLRDLARFSVAEVADLCAVDLRGDDGRLQRVAIAAADPRKEELAWEVSHRYPTDTWPGAGGQEAIRSGEPQVFNEITDEALRAQARDAEHLRLLRAMGLRSEMLVPLSARGRTLGMIWFASAESGRAFDAASISLAHELAERAAIALENARLYRDAQEANRVKDEFLATLSHELRTPLNAIVGWTHLLRTGQLDDPTSQRALETIERNARLQSQLISDILDASRIVSGQLRVERTAVDLALVVAAAADAVRAAAESKGLHLITQAESAGPVVIGDAGRLQQVVQNLLNNAVKFTPRGGEVRVHLRVTPAVAELSVQDTGSGIAIDFLPHVFERFRQGDSSTTRPHGGLGLGLAIARHLVDAHGGSLEAASSGPGQGATFTIRLPISASGTLMEVEPAPRDPSAVQLKGVRVLVVDGEDEGRRALAAILERAGAKVAGAASAQEAEGLLEGFRPHVLVTDVGRSEEDGCALVDGLPVLPRERGGGIAALAVTAQVREQLRQRVLAAGFQLKLSKPVDPIELAAMVARLAQGAGGPLRES